MLDNTKPSLFHIPLPDDPRHQRFADLLLRGENNTEAYLQAGYKCKRTSAQAQAKRLRSRPDVAAYMEAVRRSAAGHSVLTHQEIREFCARVVRTPITKLDIDTETDADLIKSFRHSESELGSNTSLEKHDPFKAIEIDMKLSGEDPEANAMTELANALRGLAPASPIPTGKM